jgi:hypothetical protein
MRRVAGGPDMTPPMSARRHIAGRAAPSFRRIRLLLRVRSSDAMVVTEALPLLPSAAVTPLAAALDRGLVAAPPPPTPTPLPLLYLPSHLLSLSLSTGAATGQWEDLNLCCTSSPPRLPLAADRSLAPEQVWGGKRSDGVPGWALLFLT